MRITGEGGEDKREMYGAPRMTRARDSNKIKSRRKTAISLDISSQLRRDERTSPLKCLDPIFFFSFLFSIFFATFISARKGDILRKCHRERNAARRSSISSRSLPDSRFFFFSFSRTIDCVAIDRKADITHLRMAGTFSREGLWEEEGKGRE